jgi:hypothetical protein
MEGAQQLRGGHAQSVPRQQISQPDVEPSFGNFQATAGVLAGQESKVSPPPARAATSGPLKSRDVFISYRSEDRSAAERMCWIAPRDILPGKEWATAIVEGIYSSRVLVVVLSSHSISAKQISREAGLADERGLTIITFRAENVVPPPALSYFLGNLQWLDGFGDQFDNAVARLVEVVQTGSTAAGGT